METNYKSKKFIATEIADGYVYYVITEGSSVSHTLDEWNKQCLPNYDFTIIAKVNSFVKEVYDISTPSEQKLICSYIDFINAKHICNNNGVMVEFNFKQKDSFLKNVVKSDTIDRVHLLAEDLPKDLVDDLQKQLGPDTIIHNTVEAFNFFNKRMDDLVKGMKK